MTSIVSLAVELAELLAQDVAVPAPAATLTAIAAVITAAGAAYAAVTTARARASADRAAAAAATVQENVGTKNGRGDVVKMLEDVQDEVGLVVRALGRLHDQVNSMDTRVTDQTRSTDQRLTGLHDAMVAKHQSLVDELAELKAHQGGQP